MPHTDPGSACQLVLRFLPALPAWPQLPRKSPKENMYVQYSEGFPGFILERERFYVQRSTGAGESLERLYQAHLDNNFGDWKITPEYAAGLHRMVKEARRTDALAIKGQITGPISWGLTVTDEEKRPILYDDTLSDAMARHLRLKAAWLQAFLNRGTPFQIIVVDEPYMSAYGSAYVSIAREKVVSLLEEVFKGMTDSLKGLHCCGNTDWSVLLGTSADIMNPDVYNYASSFNLYPEEIKEFLARGGIVAWGIVPNEEVPLQKETVSSLRDRLEDVIAPLIRKGIRFRELLERSLVTPSCGLEGLSLDGAAAALETLAGVSKELRRKYLGEAG